jgi:hypothetical protein
MRSRGKAARMDRRELRKLDKELSKIGGFGEPPRPQPHKAKDFLGAAVTLAVIGAIILEITNVLASRCQAGLNPRTGSGSCTGVAAFAHHARTAVTLSVAACAALAVIAFIWYMFWGYKTNGPAENHDTPGP